MDGGTDWPDPPGRPDGGRTSHGEALPPSGLDALADDASLDARLTRALEQYRSLLEAGHRLDRTEFLARDPTIADLLDECLAGLEFVHAVAPQLSGTGRTRSLPEAWNAGSTERIQAAMALGDFRIVREIGRGGMGIVYEAEQLSLGRRVAVKVLPFAGALDARQLERFKHEAQAAAQLHHGNIVPVFYVGCERGVHFYAMQLIEGRTLAQVIAGLRESTSSVDAVAEESEAVQSPSRLRGSEPGTGVVDETLAASATGSTLSCHDGPGFFRTMAGLGIQVAQALEYAHLQGVVHRDIKPSNLLLDLRGKAWVTDFGLALAPADATLTMTGDLLGTLRYMSPEQALGRRVLVDHRTDIYSLGVTLYELLTLQPAYQGRDREELLRQIAQDEPKPPRRLNPAVPVELETIVSKAISKAPEDRYTSAGELADDLQRFLDDRPIHARRPTLAQRARKWGRRHTPLVVSAAISAAALLILAVASLAISNRLISSEQVRTRQALGRAKAGFEAADAERLRAEANLQKAMDTVDRLLTRVSEQRLAGIPEFEPLRRELLEDALKLCQELLDQNGESPAVRYELALGQSRVGRIYSLLNQLEQAEHAFRESIALASKLAQEFPEESKFRSTLAEANVELGRLLLPKEGRQAEAEGAYRRALGLLERLAAEVPSDTKRAIRQAVAHREWGYLLWQAGRLSEAELEFRRALELQGKLPSENGARGLGRLELARTWNSLGLLLRQSARAAEAEQAHRRAVALLDAENLQVRRTEALSHEAARSYGHLGLALRRQGRRDEAEAALRRAIDIRQKAVDRWPKSRFSREELALTWFSLADLLEAAGRADEAEQAYGQAIAGWQLLCDERSGPYEHRHRLGSLTAALGGLLYRRGRLVEAETLFKQAETVYRQALLEFPGRSDVQDELAWLLATCPEAQRRQPAEAIRLAEGAIAANPGQSHYWSTLAVAQYRRGDYAAAIRSVGRSTELSPAGEGLAALVRAMAHARLGEIDAARDWLRRGTEWILANNPDNLELAQFRAEAEELILSGPASQSGAPDSASAARRLDGVDEFPLSD
ncbi:MAG: protein kinase [Pirellulales bacterium]